MNLDDKNFRPWTVHRIIVPHDLTVRSNRALQLAGMIAQLVQARVLLLHVISPAELQNQGADHFIGEFGHVVRERWRFLQIAAKRCLTSTVAHEIQVLFGNPERTILEQVQKWNADLLIITTHPGSTAEIDLQNAKADHLLHEASCPVLTIQVPRQDALSRAREELRRLSPHSLNQYCEFSRNLSQKVAYRPVYLGYSRLPSAPLGVCD